MKTLLRKHIKNTLTMLSILLASFVICVFLQEVLAVGDHITTVFVVGVFLVSLLTDGYVYGILSAFISVLTAPENLLSALVMIVISTITSALTTRLKKWQSLRAEGEREMMRANLLRAVSHDLRTPLTTIYGAGSAILDNYDALTEEQKKKMIASIKEDSEWLIRMVENLLSVTRIDSGEIKLIKSPTVLEELIDSVILKFKKRYPAQEVEIVLPEEMVLIPMDAILIEQVLVNLLENAVQHAKGMTRLSLRVFPVGGKAIFEVADNGCGMEKERLATVFVGTDNTGGRSSDAGKRGFGIGLSVCAAIIRAHAGSITAENAAEGGAIFRFTLDMEEEHDNGNQQ